MHPHIDSIPTLDLSQLDDVRGGAGVRESLGNAWEGTRNFGGGLYTGLRHGVRAKTTDLPSWADSSSRATKAGFEIGAAFSPNRRGGTGR